MDITRGEFDDFYSSSSGRSSRDSQSRLSHHGSVCSSLEMLPSDQVLHQNSEKLSPFANGSKEKNDRLSPVSNLNALNDLNEVNIKSRRFLSSSLSDNSAVSSSSDTDSFETLTEKSENSPAHVQLTPEEIEMEKAIKKMQKLDRILMSKMKHEREVKRQRLLIQKSFYSDLEKLEAETKNGTYSDITNNTSKYLALLPPSQQLDVLLEQHQEVDDFEPIFQTQLYSTHSMPSSDQTSERMEYEKHRPKSATEENSEVRDELKRTKKTRSASSTKNKHKDDKQTNFIERNIELAKDAGSMVAMTDEEKKRLEQLLEDSKEEDLPLLEGEDSDIPSHLVTTRFGEGFTPEQTEAVHLQEIDNRLQALFSPAVFTCISSSSLMHRTIPNTSSEIRDIGRKIAKSSLSEALTPEQRLDEIDDKLSKLNESWKEKCDVIRPRLSDEQLHRLLDEYSRSTSPNSIVTSNFSKLDFRHEDRSSPVSNHSELPRTSLELPSEDSRCSSRSSDATLTSENFPEISKLPVLEKSVLEDLLREAKQSLGISESTEITEDDESALPSSPVTPDVIDDT